MAWADERRILAETSHRLPERPAVTNANLRSFPGDAVTPYDCSRNRVASDGRRRSDATRRRKRTCHREKIFRHRQIPSGPSESPVIGFTRERTHACGV